MWLIFAILAAVFWGSYIVVVKVVTSPKYFGISQASAALFILLGIAVVFAANIIYEISAGKFQMPQSKTGILFAVLSGVLWGGGMVASLLALKSGADVSKISPIYNTNTLIAVLLGIILLGELPKAAAMTKVIIGAIMIVVGSVLVAI
jgi:uncharacterized membrane protein